MMKKTIKLLIPNWVLLLYNYIKRQKEKSRKAREIFTEYYNNNHWQSDESISGRGSEISQTKSLIKELEILLKDFSIKSILDIPCGDFNWMQKVDLSNIDYIGADIVEELIDLNIKKYNERDNLEFKVLNLISDPLPECDLIIVRDCLVHLSYLDILNAIKNIKSSGCKYLLATTFTKNSTNLDKNTGDWRRLNFQAKPFNFPEPLLLIIENCTEGEGMNQDKALALWEIDKIKLPPTLVKFNFAFNLYSKLTGSHKKG